nr:MAG TPA: hypothetical protein [Caudoviricetes sp.]
MKQEKKQVFLIFWSICFLRDEKSERRQRLLLVKWIKLVLNLMQVLEEVRLLTI